MKHSGSNKKLQEAAELFAWAARELPIRFFGDDILNAACESVKDQEFGTEAVKKIAEELKQVLAKYRKHTGMGRGLAANQIGYKRRIVAIWLKDKPTIMCNPKLISSEGTASYWESCISSGSLLIGEVHRPWKAKFEYRDINGRRHYLDADEKETRVMLHEMDHLDGITCDQKYQSKTMRIVAGGKVEILGYKVKRI